MKKKIKHTKNIIIHQTLKLTNNPNSPDTTENNNEYLTENLKTTLDLAKISFEDELTRGEKLDNKFNFLLVFVAGLITTLNFILPHAENTSYCEILIINVLLGIFMGVLFASCILIFIGMMPRSHHALDEITFTNMDFHQKPSQNVFGGYIQGLSDAIEKCHSVNEKKAKILKAAFILSLISFFFVCVLLIIKIF